MGNLGISSLQGPPSWNLTSLTSLTTCRGESDLSDCCCAACAPRPPGPDPVPRHGSTRQDISQREVSNTKHNDRTSPTTHIIRSRLTKCVTCHAPHLSAHPLPHPDIGAAIIPAASWPRRVADSTDGTGEGLERAELGCVHPSSVPGSGSGRWWTRSPPGPQLLMPPARHRAWSQPSTATCTWPHALATPHGTRLARMRRRHVCRGRSPGGHRPVLS